MIKTPVITISDQNELSTKHSDENKEKSTKIKARRLMYRNVHHVMLNTRVEQGTMMKSRLILGNLPKLL